MERNSLSSDFPDNLTLESHKSQAPAQEPDSSLVDVSILLTVVYLAIFLIGVIGNVCNCLVIADSRNKYMKTATNYYLFSLSVSDLLLLTFGLPHDLVNIWHPSPYLFTQFVCISRGWISEASTYASVLVIVAFTVERYLAICHPLKAHTLSRLSRSVKIIVSIWVVASSCALVVVMQYGVIMSLVRVGPNGQLISQKQCTIVNGNETIFELSVLIFFIVPMTVITILYVKLGYHLRQKTKLIKQNQLKRQRQLLSGDDSQQQSVVSMSQISNYASNNQQQTHCNHSPTMGPSTANSSKVDADPTSTKRILSFWSLCAECSRATREVDPNHQQGRQLSGPNDIAQVAQCGDCRPPADKATDRATATSEAIRVASETMTPAVSLHADDGDSAAPRPTDERQASHSSHQVREAMTSLSGSSSAADLGQLSGAKSTSASDNNRLQLAFSPPQLLSNSWAALDDRKPHASSSWPQEATSGASEGQLEGAQHKFAVKTKPDRATGPMKAPRSEPKQSKFHASSANPLASAGQNRGHHFRLGHKHRKQQPNTSKSANAVDANGGSSRTLNSNCNNHNNDKNPLASSSPPHNQRNQQPIALNSTVNTANMQSVIKMLGKSPDKLDSRPCGQPAEL